jgi:hypothetical protein
MRALVVYGSRARLQSTPDEYSDLDLVLYVIEREWYGKKGHWIADIAEPWLAVLDHTGAGDPEWFVLFESGIKVDIILSEAGPNVSLEALLATTPYTDAIDQGIRVLYESTRPSTNQKRKAPEKTDLVSSDEADLKRRTDHVLMKITAASMLFGRGDLERAGVVIVSGVRPVLQELQALHSSVSEDAGLQTEINANGLNN